MNSLYTASNAMMAQQIGIEVVSNNIANINTTAYRKKRADFSDLMYRQIHKDPIQREKYQSVNAYNEAQKIPSIVEVGVGARLSGVNEILIHGSLKKTGNQLDISVNGDGYFMVHDIKNNRFLYTRDGAFNINRDGYLATHSGHALISVKDEHIFVPEESIRISIDSDGKVMSFNRNEESTFLGRIALVGFINEGGLQSLGDNAYAPTHKSGIPIHGAAGQPGFGDIVQGTLESSNVDPIAEITSLISMQRVYEFCAKVLTATDEMMKKVSNAEI